MNKNINLGILSVILVTVIVYASGLSGGFIFDDLINLKNIAIFSQFEGIEAYLRYVFSYTSGSLKRPISTLSFLLNSTQWPANPISFKITNLLIHLVNGLLLYKVSSLILNLTRFPKKLVTSVALLHMAIWVVHPYFVSTTLYVVQRMAMLPVMFILLGFYFYITGRNLFQQNLNRGRLYFILGIYGCTLFAVLSKENGIILPILILMFEITVAAKHSPLKLGKIDRAMFFILPPLVIALAFIINIPSFLSGYGVRDFSMVERLLTESRVVTLYLYHFFIPEYFTEGVFTDVIEVSKSILKPVVTLTSVLFLVSLLVLARVNRYRYPLISFSIYFFFLSHIIESTIVPLELYFEHRGYMSLLFIALPIVQFLVLNLQHSLIKKMVLLVILITLPVTTYFRSQLWGDNVNLILESSIKYPNSVRAVENASFILSQSNLNQEALNLLKNTIKINNKLSLEFNYFILRCGLGLASKKDIEHLLTVIKVGKINKDDKSTLHKTLNLLGMEKCKFDNTDYAKNIVEIVKQKKGYKDKRVKQVIDLFEAEYFLKNNTPNLAFVATVKYLKDYKAYNNTLYLVEQFILSNEILYAKKILNQLDKQLEQEWFLPKNYKKMVEDYRNHIKTLEL